MFFLQQLLGNLPVLVVEGLCVIAVLGQQLAVGAPFDDPSAVHDQYQVRILDGRDAVGDDEHGTALLDALELLLDIALRLHVHGRRGVVQDQDGRILQEGPGQGDALLLAAGEPHATLAYDGVVAVRHGVDEVVGIRHDCGFLHLLEAAVRPAVGDVALDGVGEQEHVLHGHADVIPQVVQVHVPDIRAVHQHLPGGGVIEPAQQVHQRGLAGACGADDAYSLPGLHAEIDVLYDVIVAVAVGHVLEFHLAADLLMGIAEGIRVVPGKAGRAHLGLLAVGGVDLLHGGDEVLDIVDPPARHAQGRVEHPQIAVDLYQVSHGDLPLDDHVPAVEHQDDGEGVGQDLEDRHVFHPHPGALDLGVPEPVVLDLELALLVFFLGEGLHHPVAADVLLDEGVQGGEAVAVALESGLHLFGLLEGGDGREGQHHQHAQGQLRAHGEDHHQREDEQQHVLVHGVDDIGHEIPDGVHVSRLAAHQVAGALLIIKVEVLLQQLPVHGAAHVVEDALGGRLEHELVQEAQDAVEQRDPHQACD